MEKNDVIFTKDDVIDAYRKLKTYFYYDNSDLFMKRKIADFEYNNEDIDYIFDHLAKILNTKSEDISEYFVTDKTILRDNLVDFYLLPKSFDNNILDEDCKNIIITNRYTSEIYEFSKFNFLIDIPIELHIINVLWIVKLGYLLDSDYCYYSDKYTSYCYANRLEIDKDKECILPGNKLFKLYSSQYQKWRDDCIEATEDLLNNHKKDAIIISLDIKRYYPSVKLNYEDVNATLKQKCNNKQFDKYKFLTNILKNIRDEYIKQIKKVIIKEENDFGKILPSETPIPIGMLSSNVIANWYLKDFDKQLIKQVKPIYYGRYVDDMLIVLENTGGCNKDNCDKTNCVENRKLTTKNIIENYFCKGIKKQILEPDTSSDNKDDVEYNINIHNCKLKIQEKKIKLFVFDTNGSKAMLLKFKDNLRKHSSEFRFLPDEDRIDEDFVQNSYSIDYCDTINKLRSVDSYQLDKFKISTYLAKQLTLAKYAKDNNHYAKTKEELLYAFSGRLGLDLYCYWDKVLTYFLLNNDEASICNFIKKIGLSIERISYKADNKENKKELENKTKKDIENKIKKELESYLKEALYLTLSLYPKYIYKNTNDPNQDLTLKNLFYKLNQAKGYFAKEYDEVVSAYRKSLMIKHKYCFMPIINYLDLPSDSNLSFIERDLTKCLKKGNFNLDSKKFNFNPRNFTIEDILLLEYYQQFIENTKSINKIHENAVNNYVNLNLKQYSSEIDNSFYEKKQKAIQKYFNKILSPYTENQPYEINIDKNNENKSIDLYKVRFGLYNTKVLDSDITKNIQGNLNLTFKDLQKLIKFLNMSIQTNASKANIIVFPEVSVPIQWLGLLSDFSKKHNVAIICGLKHIIDKDTKVVQNYIATILPFKYGYKNDCYITFRLKKWYAPGEEKEIKKYKLNVPETASKTKNILFVWNNLHFAVYDCYELADIQFRSEFKSKVDFIIGCEWNRDIKYFTNITEAAARDLHCYVIQVNTSQFGDSKIIAPKKSDEMTILNIKGGDDNILIGEVNIEELREFQRKETLYLEDKDKTYKTLPPNFNKNEERLNK